MKRQWKLEKNTVTSTFPATWKCYINVQPYCKILHFSFCVVHLIQISHIVYSCPPDQPWQWSSICAHCRLGCRWFADVIWHTEAYKNNGLHSEIYLRKRNLRRVYRCRHAPNQQRTYLIMTHWLSTSITILRYILSVSAYTWGGFSYEACIYTYCVCKWVSK